MDMTHFNQDRCMAYIQGKSKHAERETFEIHLSQCDSCLTLFLSCIEISNNNFPEIQDEQQWTEQTMNHIKNISPLSEDIKPLPQKLLENKVFHFTIAASITLVLTFSGAFQQIVQHAASLTKQASTFPQTSISKQIVNRSSSWLHAISQNTLKGEKQ